MGIFLPLSPPPLAVTANVKKLSIVYSVILVVFAVTQLFMFESFRANFELLWEGYEVLALTVAIVIVTTEVLALPFLLGMKLGQGLRWISVVASWLVPLVWLLVVGCTLTNQTRLNDIGFLGGVVALEPGLWAVFVCLALGILSIWASWGMWPGRTSVKKQLSK